MCWQTTDIKNPAFFSLKTKEVSTSLLPAVFMIATLRVHFGLLHISVWRERHSTDLQCSSSETQTQHNWDVYCKHKGKGEFAIFNHFMKLAETT